MMPTPSPVLASFLPQAPQTVSSNGTAVTVAIFAVLTTIIGGAIIAVISRLRR